MWKEDVCCIANFLQTFGFSNEEVDETEYRAPECPEWLQEMTAEQIGQDVFKFGKEEFPEDPFFSQTAGYHYWQNKGIQISAMPADIQLKIEKAERLTNNLQKKEKEERIRQERQQLPSLVKDCVDWAKSNEIKPLLVRDVNTFALENELDLLRETIGALCSMANTRLKKEK
jgi:hypothetical protein